MQVFIRGHYAGQDRIASGLEGMAKGSLMETETFFTLAVRLNFLTPPQAEATLRLITEISKMLTSLRAKLLTP
jgi:four helix bundle protein